MEVVLVRRCGKEMAATPTEEAYMPACPQDKFAAAISSLGRTQWLKEC